MKNPKLEKAVDDSKSLNIAMFTNNYLPFISGVAISVNRLAESLRKKGHKVYIFTPTFTANDLPSDEYTVRIKSLFNYKSGTISFPVSNIFSSEIEKTFSSLNIDIVHIHHPFWLGSIGLKLAKKYNKPVVLTCHTRFDHYSHYLPVFRNFFRKYLSHKIIKNFSDKCDVIFSPTNTSKQYLEHIGVKKEIEIFPTGVDLDNYKNAEKKRNSEYKTLFSIARLSKEKNLYFILDCLKYIKENSSVQFQVYIAGDGPEKENLLKKISEYGLENNVELLGSVSQKKIIEYTLMSDIFVFSSKSETQGMVLLEAMAGGLPVIAVNATGVEDVVINDFNGYMTEENIEEWSEKLLLLMQTPEKLDELSDNAKKFAQNYSTEEMANKALNIYHKIYAQKKGAIYNEYIY